MKPPKKNDCASLCNYFCTNKSSLQSLHRQKTKFQKRQIQSNAKTRQQQITSFKKELIGSPLHPKCPLPRGGHLSQSSRRLEALHNLIYPIRMVIVIDRMIPLCVYNHGDSIFVR